MKIRPMLVAVIVATAVVTAVGQTRPADSPKGALKALAASLAAADQAGIRGGIWASGPQEEAAVDAIVDMAAALGKLREAAVEKFGKEGAMGLTGDMAQVSEEQTRRIDQANLEEKDDLATLDLGDGSQVTLRRVGGAWKLPVPSLVPEGAKLPEAAASLQLQAKIVRETADDIAAGKYQSAEQAMQAMMGNMLRETVRAGEAEGAREAGGAATTRAADNAASTRPAVGKD